MKFMRGHSAHRVLPVLLSAVILSLAGASVAGAAPKHGSVVKLTTVKVGSPGNPSVGIVPFTDAIYQECSVAPDPTSCLTVGAVNYRYQMAELEVTVGQWVEFLNVADPTGRNPHGLYNRTESSKLWPKYGQIDFARRASNRHHYSVAYPAWADKPYGFANFLRAARFDNSLYNGRVLSKKASSGGGFPKSRTRVRLSPRTESGMYDLSRRAPRRSHGSGFVIPSQNEWIKAAYFDPNGGGTFSYWKYPTNAGTFFTGGETDAPTATALDPSTGDVTNAATQPLATFNPNGFQAPSPPTWCPARPNPCANVNPFGLDPTAYKRPIRGASAPSARRPPRSPWGTLDQGGDGGGEWDDTTPLPPPPPHPRGWGPPRGGISPPPVSQVWTPNRSGGRLAPLTPPFPGAGPGLTRLAVVGGGGGAEGGASRSAGREARNRPSGTLGSDPSPGRPGSCRPTGSP